MTPHARIVAVAAVAGLVGIAASIWLGGPGPLLRSEMGQRAVQAVVASRAPAPPDDLKVARRGEAIPRITLREVTGNRVELPGAYSGRPVLVNFWASWCGPCLEEMPELDRYAKAQGGTGTQVVGIALDDADAVRRFLQHTPVAYPILLDTAGPRDSGVVLGNPKGVLPYSVLLDADGTLLKQRIGPFGPGEIDDWAAF